MLLLMVTPASGEPRVEITPILYAGDPAPGIPDATMTWMGAPQIDGNGNVLICGYFRCDGDPWDRPGLWYGGPGSLEVIMYEGMQAPDLPEGVVLDYVGTGRLSENGWIGYTGYLSGPGIISGVNNLANFVGPPGDIRNVLQGGEPAPGLESGTVITPPSRGGGCRQRSRPCRFTAARSRSGSVVASICSRASPLQAVPVTSPAVST